MARILMIDDDYKLAELVTTYLKTHGFVVDHAATVAVGLQMAAKEEHDAVLLDLMLPDGDGLDVCRTLRAKSQIPILMLTARGDELDRIVGLELGADDYLPKPFNPRELAARLKAILRRSRPHSPKEELIFGPLRINLESRVVTKNSVHCPLTQHQFRLLAILAEHPGRVLSRSQLMAKARGEELEAFDRSIDVHISRIRSAIEVDAKKPQWVLTVRGAGYVFTGKGQ